MALIISGGDGSANRAEVQQLVTWCSEQNLVLILRRKKKSSQNSGRAEQTGHQWRLCGGGSIILNSVGPLSLTGSPGLPTLQLQFSKLSTTIESILVDCVTVWLLDALQPIQKTIQRVTSTAQRPLAKVTHLPRALKHTKDSSHSRHLLCDLLP